MYVPPAFAVDDRRWALETIARYPFATLLVAIDDGSHVTHLPVLSEVRGDDVWLIGHVARANPAAQAILKGAVATCVFVGAHAYVSASWYEEPYETVPTWDYSAVHVSGKLRECDARRVVAALSDAFEAGRPDPWRWEQLDETYFNKQLRGIVAFELRAETIVATAKLSQNRTAADRERVIAALARSERPLDRECAAEMTALRGEAAS